MKRITLVFVLCAGLGACIDDSGGVGPVPTPEGEELAREQEPSTELGPIQHAETNEVVRYGSWACCGGNYTCVNYYGCSYNSCEYHASGWCFDSNGEEWHSASFGQTIAGGDWLPTCEGLFDVCL